MTKCIANRTERVLNNIIHKDQTGFMKERYIGDNIRIIFDMINYLEEKNLPGILFSIDFEKAFDSVQFPFIKKCLNYLTLG